MATSNGEDGEVFQDFESDASDVDDDVDWNFTDGESASVLQLMGGADSTKKSQCGGTDVISHSVPVKTTDPPRMEDCNNSIVEVSVVSSSDEDLLAELFPEIQPEPTKKSTADEVNSPAKECEVEWALMALEEHEQLEQRSQSTTAANADADFVSLFEEMYGGDTSNALSTPSLPKELENCRQNRIDSKQFVEKEKVVIDSDGVCSTSKTAAEINGKVPSEALEMLRLVYKKVMETQGDFSALLSETSSTLCLPDHVFLDQNSKSSCSLNSFVELICSLEVCLSSHDFVKSLAATREERLELVIVALDDKIDALPYNFKNKWAKALDMLPLLAKMREQTSPLAPTSKPVTDQPQVLLIDTTLPPAPTQLKHKKRSPLEGWATFHPEKMPTRRCETMSSKSKQPGHTKKPRVRVRQYLPSKLRVRCKAYNPEDKELTFRPNINRKSPHHRKGGPKQHKETFTARMERDISKRRSQKLQHEREREQQDREEVESVSTVKLIDMGSQRILLKNGMWAESLEERISRLAKHRTNIEASDSRSKKRRERHEQRKREATAVASRACESLYQRGVEQRKREQERLLEDQHDLEFQRNRPKISSRSLRVMKTRIRQELAQLCMDSRRTANAESSGSDEGGEAVQVDSPCVTFIQFSCALLYFGFVTDLNTPWEGGNGGDQGNEITLLWHSWTVFTRDHTGTPGSKLALKLLERVLFSVILGGRVGEHKVLQNRYVQTLLRMYRANYYTRKHTQLKADDRKQNNVEVGAQSTKKKRSSSRRQRVRYTLHGKPIRNIGSPETDFLSEREQLLQEKIDQMREAKMKQDLDGCTFHPHVNPGPTEAAGQRSTRQSSPPKPVRTSSATVSTFERLYSDAFQRQNNVLEKYLEAKQHREELERRESKVHPSYVNGMTIEERLEHLHVALAGNALPVDFHKKIDAMRGATEMKALDEQMKEQKLLPVHFKRAEDGRIIVRPFQFATEIRAALSTGPKKQRTKSTHRPRDHVMRDLRPAAYEEDREIPTTVQPPPRKTHEDIERSEHFEADLCLDVHLSPSETRQIYLNMHDDPREVVDDFAGRFSLTNTQRHFLVQLVEARLEQFSAY
ncbi:hypothetical protein PF008_g10486 [Phytophthora fragariae]|uniref:Uncharacterized protein n=1 Tax=Phytophthora fragariae TaxID=53985 RepID=A0A6G0RTH1_9STRA|nr:hypothetical protein PF008_g10486 [Phytophthora fragariae]